jgi:hypothetical protein
MAALYEQNYMKAAASLGASLQARQQNLATDQMTRVQEQSHVSDAAFFLGSAL